MSRERIDFTYSDTGSTKEFYEIMKCQKSKKAYIIQAVEFFEKNKDASLVNAETIKAITSGIVQGLCATKNIPEINIQKTEKNNNFENETIEQPKQNQVSEDAVKMFDMFQV